MEDNDNILKGVKVVGREHFKCPNTDFIITPLTTAANLHLYSVADGTTDDRVVGEVSSTEYTKVTGAIPYLEFYIDTDETFVVKW